jgi:hypothetical protein
MIGISDYPRAPLLNAAADAERAARAVEKRGFETNLLLNAAGSDIDAALASFSSSLAGADLGLIYLAGHGVERHGTGYFLPADFPFPLTTGRLKHCGISLNDLVRAAQPAKSAIVVLDACRTWPEDRTEQVALGSAMDELVREERSWSNLLLAYSTSASALAGDGGDGEGSLFCQAFCRHLLDHKLTVEECFHRIVAEVTERSQFRQQPWTYSSLSQLLSFSDLPTFKPLHRHKVPISHAGGTWCIPDRDGSGVIIGDGDRRAWHVDLGGWHRVNWRGSKRLVGGAHLDGYLFLAAEEGKLFCAGDNATAVVQIECEATFGLAASPDRYGFVHYGGNTATVFRVRAKQLREVQRVEADFEIYSCAYLSDELIWLGGYSGHILELSISGGKTRERRVGRLNNHINAMAVSPDRKRVFCAGQSTLLAEVGLDGQVLQTFLEPRWPQTAPGIRAALLDVANDYVIRDFIFQPSKLRPGVYEELQEHIDYSNLLSCSHAPGLPLLAVGTDESTVLLFDTRDGQMTQEIDISSGLPGSVSGVVFLSDRELVAVGFDGQALFLAA